jgi:hypothetical protein
MSIKFKNKKKVRRILPPPMPDINPPRVRDIENTFDTNEIRILKQEGFYGVTLPIAVRVPSTDAATAANYTAPFFIANTRDYELLDVRERHETAGSDGGDVTVMLKKVPSGTAPASGSDMLSAEINLKATANINQTGSITTTSANRVLKQGESMALIVTGTPTDVAGVTVSVLLRSI